MNAKRERSCEVSLSPFLCKWIYHTGIRSTLSHRGNVLRLPALLIDDSFHVGLNLTEVAMDDITDALLSLRSCDRLDKGIPFLLGERLYPTAGFLLQIIIRIYDHSSP